MRWNELHNAIHMLLLYEDEEKFQLTDIMEFHFIEMPKLIRDWKKDKLNPWDDVLARWLLLLGIVDHRKGEVYDDIFKELEEIAMKDETLRTAIQSWEALSGNVEEMLAYEARMKHVLDEEAMIREAELREIEAREKGMQIGLQEGLQQGRQEEKKEMARRLLAKGMDIKDVVETTELAEELVLKIKQELVQ